MPYDAGCSVYWCDQCGKMMDIDYQSSSDFGLVLKCAGNEPCNFRRFFVATERESFEEVGHDPADNVVDSAPAIPSSVLPCCDPELVPGVLDRTAAFEARTDEEAEPDDGQVRESDGGS